ncbi:ankyrin repeat-containing domain protein [Aspergillus cavernicola]|uniref:Ankyrin repeat-containing domain protein n=1 Tax=Aspergillus cavernicola TaxID=176166 RepID=A0ABR4IY81_9EURO
MMLLIKAGVNVNSVTGINNVTPLLLATSKSHFRAAELLVNHGADVNIADTLGRSPLINAAELGTLSIVDLLVRRGADINHTNSAGRSALTFGVEKGAANVVQRLVDAGCDVNLVDHIEKTALYYAPGNWAPWNRIDEIIQGAPGYKPRKR